MEQILEELAKRIAKHLQPKRAPVKAAPVLATPKRRGRKPKNLCKEKGCERPVRCKSRCSAHYQTMRREALKS